MKNFKNILFGMLLLLPFFQVYSINISNLEQDNNEDCQDYNINDILKFGLDGSKPYNFKSGVKTLGVDFEIAKAILQKMDKNLIFKRFAWGQKLTALSKGKVDIISASILIKKKREYAYFSKAYRYREDSLFLLKETRKLDFSNINEFLVQIRLRNFRLGVIRGYSYVDPDIDKFINDNLNKNIVRVYDSNIQALEGLLNGKVDGFITEKLEGSTVVIDNHVANRVKEEGLNVKIPIHFMFSKKSVTLDFIVKFNKVIDEFCSSREYNSIISKYIYPILFVQTVNSEWFYVISIIGTISFVLSGIAIAVKDNNTLFGTIILALLPSIGTNIVLDIVINNQPVGMLLEPLYIYYSLVIVLVGFALLRLLSSYSNEESIKGENTMFWDHLFIICDAFGQAVFLIIGIAVVVIIRINPVELWAPFFAFLSANAGCILRNLLRKNRLSTDIFGEINFEVSIFWAMLFIFFLEWQSYELDQEKIKYATMGIILGSFISRLAIYYLKIPNLYFREEI